MESTTGRTTQPFRINAYFEPDVLTTFEYSKTFHRRDHVLPEMNLMFAVLTNAIECLQKYAGAKSRRCRKMFHEAEAWIFSGNAQALYSFELVCEALQLDSGYLRKGVARWRDQTATDNGPRRRVREPLRYTRRLRSPRITV
jgi:hypothetical protein